MLAAGVVGFLMRMLKFPFLPTVLGLVLGYLVESSFRRSLVISGDDYGIFMDDRISLTLLCVAGLFIFGSIGKRIWSILRHSKRATFSEGTDG
jgi:putative tricarboxylic transport membrane protein